MCVRESLFVCARESVFLRVCASVYVYMYVGVGVGVGVGGLVGVGGSSMHGTHPDMAASAMAPAHRSLTDRGGEERAHALFAPTDLNYRATQPPCPQRATFVGYGSQPGALARPPCGRGAHGLAART